MALVSQGRNCTRTILPQGVHGISLLFARGAVLSECCAQLLEFSVDWPETLGALCTSTAHSRGAALPTRVVQSLLLHQPQSWHNMSHAQWFSQVYPSLSRLGLQYHECTQHAGDMLWAPGGTFHATYNTLPCASISQNVVNSFNQDAVFGDLHSAPLSPSPTGSKRAGAICFDQNSQRPLDFMRSLYLCVALSVTHPAVFRGSCCAGKGFLSHLDSFPAYVRAVNPPPNSQLYHKILEAAAKQRVV